MAFTFPYSQLVIGIILGIPIGYIWCLIIPIAPATRNVVEVERVNGLQSLDCLDWEASPDRSVNDAWYSMKVMPRPSICKVKGVAIEELEPFHNFRRSYSLAFVGDPEDKYNINQYLLASQDLSLHFRKRRVLLDLGGKSFDSSVAWFLRNYPLDFTEVHVFEVVPGRFQIPPKHDPALDVANLDPTAPRIPGQSKPVPNWQLERIKLHNAFVSGSDGKTAFGNITLDKVNITRFIKKELKLTAQDTLIVKMDIEGAEWEVLPAWLSDPDMLSIVDELFVEIHYRHPSMSMFNWDNLFMPNGTDTPPRKQATSLLSSLRRKGIYAHAWP